METPFDYSYFIKEGFLPNVARKFVNACYAIGDKVLRDGYEYTISEILPNRDPHIVARITLNGHGNEIEVGHYDLCLHEFVNA